VELDFIFFGVRYMKMNLDFLLSFVPGFGNCILTNSVSILLGWDGTWVEYIVSGFESFVDAQHNACQIVGRYVNAVMGGLMCSSMSVETEGYS
jgi:hypothetical protein